MAQTMDRNLMARQKAQEQVQHRQLQEQRRQFAEAVQQGYVFALDRFGNKVAAGSTVLFFPIVSGLVGVVTDVVPDLNPRLQPGTLRLTIDIQVPLGIMAGQPQTSMILMAPPKTETVKGEGATSAIGDPLPSAPEPVRQDPAEEPDTETPVVTPGDPDADDDEES